jgi:spermidine/putrescine transport system substrate-binding protein
MSGRVVIHDLSRLFASLALLAWVSACEGAPADIATETPPPLAVGTTAAPATSLRILSREDQIDPDVYDAFTRETGIAVIETTYQIDDQLVDMLGGAAPDADLIVASDRAFARLQVQGRLARFDAAKLSNFNQVDARLKKLPFDPANDMSVPVLWGTVGIFYRTDRNLIAIDSWQAALDGARRNPTTTIALLDDPRTGVGAALKALGLSLNSRDSAELLRAQMWLTARRAFINRFDSAAWTDALLTGDVVIAQTYSNDAAFTQYTNANLRYVIPREGAALWVDSFALPAGGKHPAEAAAFVDFALRPANAALLAAYTYSLPAVPEAYNRMDAGRAALLRSGYIPDDETFKRLEIVAVRSDAQPSEYERIWLELRK